MPTKQARTNSDDQLQDAVVELKSRIGGLCTLCDTMTNDLFVRDEDHLGFLALFFHAKQLHHAKAVLDLDVHPDTSLVARSMLEGLCLLKWAAQEPDRALRWRMFSAIIDWRTLRDFDRDGIDVSDEQRAQVHERMTVLGDEFLSEKALRARTTGEVPPRDPWATKWYKPQLRQIFDAVGAAELYEGPYSMMSAWHHWSPEGVAYGIVREDSALSFNPRSDALQLSAMSCAFQAVAETGLLVANHFSLQSAEEISLHIKEYVESPMLRRPFSQRPAL